MQLSWESRVNNVIDFALMDPTASALVTVRDLLCHRTGLPRHDMCLMNSNATRESMVYRARYLQPTATIRDLWQYNNWCARARAPRARAGGGGALPAPPQDGHGSRLPRRAGGRF
jgi:CubicO group peptidase (beta-lactamase class C family)